LLLVTALTRCSSGALSLLVIVHVADWPNPRVIVSLSVCVQPTHTHALAELADGPVSDRS
jgi:hypothetical protein